MSPVFVESVEHILNELEDMLQSLVRRMNKSEMEDFELVIGCLLLLYTHSLHNNIIININININ